MENIDVTYNRKYKRYSLYINGEIFDLGSDYLDKKLRQAKKNSIKNEVVTEFETNIISDFRRLYPGQKLGVNKVIEQFKKHDDWKEAVHKLIPSLKSEIKFKDKLKSDGKFCPEWKNLSTWINQRCWEQEFGSEESIDFISESNKKIVDYRNDFVTGK